MAAPRRDALPAPRGVATPKGRVRCVVSGHGRPVIVLVNGAGLPLHSWAGLYPAIERLGRVVAWNRPGLPGSETQARRVSALDVVAALRDLLPRLALPPPYVLVGHSVGALHAQLFAQLHPADVAGLLLVEPTPLAALPRLLGRRAQLVRSLAKVSNEPPAALRRNLRAELAGLRETARMLSEAAPMPCVPLRVVARRRDHFPQVSEPWLVLAVLRDLLSAVRRATPGPGPATPAGPPA